MYTTLLDKYAHNGSYFDRHGRRLARKLQKCQKKNFILPVAGEATDLAEGTKDFRKKIKESHCTSAAAEKSCC